MFCPCPYSSLSGMKRTGNPCSKCPNNPAQRSTEIASIGRFLTHKGIRNDGAGGQCSAPFRRTQTTSFLLRIIQMIF